MKVLYKNMGFGGGAPKSLLEYIKIIKNNGHEVIVVGEKTYQPVDYYKENIEILNLDYFRIKKPIKNYFIMLKYLKIIQKQRPQMIHAITKVNCCFHTIIEKVTNIPIIYNIPGGKIDYITSEVLKGKEILVFSNENKIDFIKNGHSSEKIQVISNRMNIHEGSNEYAEHYQFKSSENNSIKLLLISRISSDKKESIKFVLDIVHRLLNSDVDVSLDILGNGDCFKEIESKVIQLNKSFSKDCIFMRGHVNNVNDYIKSSHIIFGKGRSVMDGIINCRISFVVSERNSISLCNQSNFLNLSTFNFSGRNIENSMEYEDLKSFLQNDFRSYVDGDEILKVRNILREHYDIKKAEEKILSLYKKNPLIHIDYKPNLIKVTNEYLLFYIKLVMIELKVKMKIMKREM